MHKNKEGWASDKDELKCPQSNVGNRKVIVVADIAATWLVGVAVKSSLLISPDTFCSNYINQKTEDEDYRQPNAPKSS